MIKLQDIQKLDYKTRLNIAIILFVVSSIAIITIFIFSMKSNINKFYTEVKDIKNTGIVTDLNSTIQEENKSNDSEEYSTENIDKSKDVESIEVNIDRDIKDMIEN